MFKKHYKMMLMGHFYKNKDQQVGATILDSKTGGLVAISGGRDFKDVVNRNRQQILTLLVHL